MEKLMWKKVFGKSLQQLCVRDKGLDLEGMGHTSSPKAGWEVIP